MSFRSDTFSIDSDRPFLGASPCHSIQLSRRKTTLSELMDDDHLIIEIPQPPTAAMFVLSFQNLSYTVKPRRFCRGGEVTDKPSKLLLDDVSGEARDGEIMAVLGASGSGKSTLIDALAGRISRESLKGSVNLNGQAIESKLLKVISAYVMQDDLLFPMLTVEETLMFSAEFRLPRTMPKSQKKERVLALIDQLGLRSAAQTVIGDEGHRGVSGGERRRVSIGIDIIHDPIILFLDEPTSGLDSTSAFMVVKVLKRIAQSGSIVIMSIHQPSYRILSLLSHLIILSAGKIVFSGSPASIPCFFAEFGNPIPVNSDRIEFALDFITEHEKSPSGNKNLSEFYQAWNKNNGRSLNALNLSLPDAITVSISRGKLVSGGTDSDRISSSVPKYANPIWKEVIIIAKRSITNSNRAPELFATRFAAVLITGIILATTFWRLDNSPKGVKEKVGFFAFAISTTFYTCAEALPVFLLQRYIFIRETSHNSYRRSSFVLSHALISIPSLLVLSLAFSATTFWAVGLSGGTTGFLSFFGFTMAAFWAGSSLVTFLSGIIVNLMMAYTIVVALLAYFLLFSGFFISRDRIPSYMIWLHYVSLVKYPYQGVMQNEFDDPLKCLVRGVQVFDDTPLRTAPDSVKLMLLKSAGGVLGMNITSSTCLTTGVDILNQAGVMDIGKWNCLLITILWGFFFRALFYVTLLIWSKNKRR